MRGISTLKQTLFCFALIWAFSSVTAFSQNQCGVLYEDFNDRGNATGGFTGSSTSSEATFDYHYWDRQGELEFKKVGPGDYTIVTPTFSIIPGSLFIDYGFKLSGTVEATSYSVKIQYQSNGQLFTSNPVISTSLDYNGETVICSKVQKDGMLGNEYRLIITFTTTSGNGKQGATFTFDDYYTSATPSPITLPVNFIGFTARQASNGAQLIWNVADEVDVARYEVQKGTTAGNFRTIGTVTAGERTSYSFLDVQPTTGVSFYRIRSVDLDGKYKFSTIISFSNGNSMALLRAYPLPARNQVTLQHGTIEGRAQVTIASEDGRVVKRVVPSTGSMQTSIDLSSLKAGLYLLRLESSNGEVQTLKLVKQ